VKLYYSLVERTEAAAAALRSALIAHGQGDEAEAICEEGPRSIAEASRRLAERIDLPNALKRKAHEAFFAAQALNPGEVGAACGGWAHHPPTHRIKGWWSVMPQCDSKVNRKL
jgi:thioredoxin-like negative regulator of GroEL